MDKEKIRKRIQALKEENDQGNENLAKLDQARQSLIQQMLVRNGRILELEEILKEGE